jgi:glucose-6-phosphate isomerase
LERPFRNGIEGVARKIMNLEVATSGASAAAVEDAVPELVREKIASRIFAKDNTIWGQDAESEAAIRLGWVDAATESLALVEELTDLRNELQSKGLTRVVLCGMGGSSLAPEVIAATFGVRLVVLDSTYPSQVRAALSIDLERTIVVVSSKSGSTVETDSQKRAFENAFEQAGIDATERIIIVTDPGSPMQKQASEDGYRIFLANPNVGGRFSALTAFGVVPSMLAGVDMQPVLLDAIAAAEFLSRDETGNPALIVGAAMAKSRSISGYKDKLGIVSVSKKIIGLGNWMEQLIAESTGKIGRGVLPIVLQDDSPELSMVQDDLLTIGLVDEVAHGVFDVKVSGGLGAQLLLWEVATVVAAKLLGVNPFDQPDVESAKIASRAFLENKSSSESFLFSESGIEVTARNINIGSGSTLSESFDLLLAASDESCYFAVHAYLDRERDVRFEGLRDLIARVSGRATSFGWGPRFLHSTGQYHKGGASKGVFLQLIGSGDEELIVPGRDFGFEELMNSQASGDADVLSEAGRAVLTLRFADNMKALAAIEKILVGSIQI